MFAQQRPKPSQPSGNTSVSGSTQAPSLVSRPPMVTTQPINPPTSYSPSFGTKQSQPPTQTPSSFNASSTSTAPVPSYTPVRPPTVSGNSTTKVIGVGEKQSGPPLAITTNFQSSCEKTPKQNTNDKKIIPWDHSNENFVYGSQELDTRGKLTKEELSRVTTYNKLDRGYASWRSKLESNGSMLSLS